MERIEEIGEEEVEEEFPIPERVENLRAIFIQFLTYFPKAMDVVEVYKGGLSQWGIKRLQPHKVQNPSSYGA